MQMETCTTFNSTKTHLGMINQYFCQHCEHLINLANKDNRRTWHCNLCDKNLKLYSKTGHIISYFHQRRERFFFLAKKYKIDKPEITQIDYNILEDVIKYCKDENVHTFEHR